MTLTIDLGIGVILFSTVDHVMYMSKPEPMHHRFQRIQRIPQVGHYYFFLEYLPSVLFMYNTTATITTKTIFSIYITVLDVKHYQNSKQPQELEGYSRHSRQPSLNNSHVRISHC